MRSLLISLALIVLGNISMAQTYVGEILYLDQYQYIKIIFSADTCTLSIPYLDGRQKYISRNSLKDEMNFSIYRGIEPWKFKLKKVKNTLKGSVELPHGKEHINLYEQQDTAFAFNVSQFTGTYSVGKDIAIIYERFGYLHMTSPFSEETVSLKPIAEAQFWSSSGEISSFNIIDGQKFQNLTIRDRSGISYHLVRQQDINRISKWITIDGDSIYTEVLMPGIGNSFPGILILPGGGNQSQIENFLFEARYFASQGVASMIFEKPGVGKSRGSNFDLLSFKEKARYYKRVLDSFLQLPIFTLKTIGLHGSSEGGRLAIMMAEMYPDEIHFVNAVAAPLMSMKEGQLYAMNHFHRNQGISEEDIVQISSIWLNYYNGIIEGQIDATLLPQISSLSQEYPRAFLPPASTDLPGSPSREDLIDLSVIRDASKIKCPVLLQYGESDQRVNPYTSIQNFYPVFPAPSHLDIMIYNRGNHSIMTPEFEICKGYLADKRKWLEKIGLF